MAKVTSGEGLAAQLPIGHVPTLKYVHEVEEWPEDVW